MGRDKTKTIFRVVTRRTQFITLDKSLARDPRLNLESVGLHFRLLCKPDDWIFWFSALARECKCSERKIRIMFNRLQVCGYTLRRLVRNRRTGVLLRWEIMAFEVPELSIKARLETGTIFETFEYPYFQRTGPDGRNPPCGQSTMWDSHHVGYPDVVNDRVLNERLELNERLTEVKRKNQWDQEPGVSGPESALPAVPPLATNVSGDPSPPSRTRFQPSASERTRRRLRETLKEYRK